MLSRVYCPSVILSYRSAMPNLSSLSTDLTISHPPSDLYTSHVGQARGKDGPSLNALGTLCVAGLPSSIEELLNGTGISSPTLHTASLTIFAHEYDKDGGRRCVALLSARFAASLHAVPVQYTRTTDRTPTDGRPFAQYARPLFPLRGLREDGYCGRTNDAAIGGNGDAAVCYCRYRYATRGRRRTVRSTECHGRLCAASFAHSSPHSASRSPFH
ncbi:hypothetical protein C8Q78DRAFT_746303 [Trametes maxima]|nr:hypothetical protein C8Q78DRAFT_746303 [Trametes maxima]